MSWFGNLPEYAATMGLAGFAGYKIGARIREGWNNTVDGGRLMGVVFLAALTLIGGPVVVGMGAYEFSRLGSGAGDSVLGLAAASTYVFSYVIGCSGRDNRRGSGDVDFGDL